jgi:hypothetical protein
VFTVRQAVRSRKPAAVVLAGGGAELPAFAGGRWQACMFGDVAAFRWVREPRAPEAESAERRRTALHRIFVVPQGEPVDALMTHISALTPGERLWFEQGVLAGDTVLVPHEAVSDTPAWLTVPRLRRRFRCGVREAAGLGELFLALDAGADVVAWYEGEVRRRGVAGVIEDLVHLVAQLAIAEAVPDSDALDEAERLARMPRPSTAMAWSPFLSSPASRVPGWRGMPSGLCSPNSSTARRAERSSRPRTRRRSCRSVRRAAWQTRGRLGRVRRSAS